MKLRINGNSIRLRLSQTEVAELADGRHLEIRTELFPQPLIYQLSSDRTRHTVSVSFDSGVLRVVLPANQIKDWAETDQVGIEAVFSSQTSESLNLLVEKDFKCLHSEAQDQEDCFANPLDEAL